MIGTIPYSSSASGALGLGVDGWSTWELNRKDYLSIGQELIHVDVSEYKLICIQVHAIIDADLTSKGDPWALEKGLEVPEAMPRGEPTGLPEGPP